MAQHIMIVGCGLPSLLVARWLRKHRPQYKVVIIEKSGQVGGQYGSYDYGDAGYFDYGIHLYYQTGNSEVDELLEDVLPQDDWTFLEGNAKDIAGLYFNGRLQTESPYVDLRDVSVECWKRYVGDLFMMLRKESPPPTTAYDYVLTRFGTSIADEVFCPIFQKMYGRHPRDLDILAAKITTIDRVVLFDADQMRDLMRSEKIRERIAFPDQFGLDQSFRTDYHLGLYPRRYGFKRVIEALRSQLEADDVEIVTDTVVTKLELRGGRVQVATLEHAGQQRRIQDIYIMIWSAGIPALCPLVSSERPTTLGFDPKPPGYYVNMFVDGDVHMDRLYYFYCFDPGFKTFRVSNHANYCADAATGLGVALCVEYWPTEADLSTQAIGTAAAEELERLGVAKTKQITWSRVEKAPGDGIPLPTLTNVASIGAMRDHVLQNKPDNLIVIGAFSSEREFFLRDILGDAFTKLERV